MELKALIETISKKAGLTPEEVEKELTVHFETLDTTIPEDDRKMMSRRWLSAHFRKELSNNAKEHEIIVLGGTGVMDMVAKRRREATELVTNNPTLAEQKNVVDAEGKPLYNSTQPKFEKLAAWQVLQQFEENPKGHLTGFKVGADKKFTKETANYVGKSLPDKDLNRSIYIAHLTEKGYVPGVLKLRGDITSIKLPTDFGVYKIMGILLDKSKEDFSFINGTSKLAFEKSKELPEKEIKELFEVTMASYTLDLDNMETWCEEHTDFDRFAIMKVFITDINPTPSAKGLRIMKVEDDSLGFEDADGNVIAPITVFIAPEQEIDFSEQNEIYLIGQPSVNDRGKAIGMLGYYIPKIYRELTDGDKDASEESK